MAARKRRGFEASRWEPPEKLRLIAEERTADIRHVWLYEAGWKPMDLAILAESCYMQGVNDAIDSLIQTGNRVVPILAGPHMDEGVIYWP